MSVTVTMQVKSCRKCPHSTNSAIEHKCAFTPEPYPTYWWCKKAKQRLWIDNPEIVDPACPIGRKQEEAEQ